VWSTARFLQKIAARRRLNLRPEREGARSRSRSLIRSLASSDGPARRSRELKIVPQTANVTALVDIRHLTSDDDRVIVAAVVADPTHVPILRDDLSVRELTVDGRRCVARAEKKSAREDAQREYRQRKID
jgi:hypothetical protein